MKRLIALIIGAWILGLGASGSLQAQRSSPDSAPPRVVPINSVPADAYVVGVLEEKQDQAVLRILRIKENNYQLERNSEILADFYFSTQKVKNAPEMSGIESGDTISLHIWGKYEQERGQWKYEALHYKHIPQEDTIDIRVNPGAPQSPE